MILWIKSYPSLRYFHIVLQPQKYNDDWFFYLKISLALGFCSQKIHYSKKL